MKKFFVSAAMLLAGMCVYADDCDLHICVVTPDTEMVSGDNSLGTMLTNQLIRALNASGVSASEGFGQLYLSGRFDDSYKETLPGPPMQTAVHTTLTLMVADVFDNKKFDSESFDLRGVGTSPQRAYINAMKQITGSNKKLVDFVRRSQKRVISYFNRNYKSLLRQAAQAAGLNNYEQAMYYAGMIPECCVGYEEANRMLLQYFQDDMDRTGIMLLRAAKAAFAISPNAAGAREAYALLAQIDPDSKCYGESLKFADEIKQRTREEYDFEVHKKYEDQMDLTRRQIDAARAIGVAYGNGQKSTTTNILWK